MNISIVLAAYNGEKYIREQLDSLRFQTRPADEVIIRDDCSTDSSYDLCLAYIKKHDLSWKLLRADTNGGYRENFRAAIEAAQGDWVILCDQDDVWDVRKIEYFEETAFLHPDASAIVCSFSCIDGKGNDLPLPAHAKKANNGLIPFSLPEGVSPMRIADEHPELLLTQNIAMGCCMGFPKNVCSRYLRITQCQFPHDWELALIASYEGEIYFINKPLIKYRLHGNNAIGLPGMFASNAPKRPSENGRLKVMDEFDGLLSSAQVILKDMGKNPLSDRYWAYSRLRREALTGKKIFKWILLHRYYDIYSRMFTLKQRLGDLYVILKK